MAAEHEGSDLASSLTDLMTSLAVIFILLLVAMLNNQRQQAAGTKSLVLSRLQLALEKFREQGVIVKSDPKDPLVLLVVVPEDLLKFERGKSDIPAPRLGLKRTTLIAKMKKLRICRPECQKQTSHPDEFDAEPRVMAHNRSLRA